MRNGGTREMVTELAAGRLWSFEPTGERDVLWCLSGTCWVTQADDPADHCLRAGDERPLRPRGRVVVEALAPSRLHRVAGAAVDPAA